MCTHNLCFEQKEEKYHNFSSKNYHFYGREKSQNIAWSCLPNVFSSLAFSIRTYEPRSEKTGLRAFRPGPTQTGLYSYRRWQEA